MCHGALWRTGFNSQVLVPLSLELKSSGLPITLGTDRTVGATTSAGCLAHLRPLVTDKCSTSIPVRVRQIWKQLGLAWLLSVLREGEHFGDSFPTANNMHLNISKQS